MESRVLGSAEVSAEELDPCGGDNEGTWDDPGMEAESEGVEEPEEVEERDEEEGVEVADKDEERDEEKAGEEIFDVVSGEKEEEVTAEDVVW